jgi:uncharacterized protein YdhG (YjbR/CyaY superfamily)
MLLRIEYFTSQGFGTITALTARTEMKSKQTGTGTVDAYIAACSPDLRARLEQLRSTIRRAAPDAQETIKYRIPTFTMTRNLVHFAAFEHHIGFYPSPSGIERFKKELSSYQSAKGSVQFPLDKPLPLTLIGRIVKFRVQEERERAGKKTR